MMPNKQLDLKEERIFWWKDKKLLAGGILVILSIIIGLYGKALSIVKFYEPVQFITGLSIWAFSWLLLFLGVFLVGWETIRMIQYKIHHHVKKTIKGTYNHAKEFPKKSLNYTRKLHKKGIAEIAKIKKKIHRLR